MVSFPYYSHIFRDSYGNSMGPAYHFRGSHVLGGPWKSHWLRVVRSNHQQMEHNFPPPPSHLAPAWRVIVEGSVPRFVRAQTSCLPVLLHAGRPACPDQSLCWTKLLGLTVKVSQVSCIIPYIISFQKKKQITIKFTKNKKKQVYPVPPQESSLTSQKRKTWNRFDHRRFHHQKGSPPSRHGRTPQSRPWVPKTDDTVDLRWDHRSLTASVPRKNGGGRLTYWDSGTFQRTVKLRGGGGVRLVEYQWVCLYYVRNMMLHCSAFKKFMSNG